jgi:hypothetical protein
MNNWKRISSYIFLTLLLGILSCEDTTNPAAEYTVVVNGQVMRLNNTGLDSVVVTLANPFLRDTVKFDGTFSLSFLTSETNDITTTLSFRHINLSYYDTNAVVVYGPTKKTIGVGEVKMRGLSSAQDSVITGRPSARPGQIAFVTSTFQMISIRGAGSNDATNLTFEVRDSLGVPVDNQNKTTVFFSIITRPDSLVELNKKFAATGSNGQVSVLLTSGFRAGLAQVQAYAAIKRASDTTQVDTIKSQIVSVTVAGGNPVPSRFTIGSEKHNVPGLVKFNQKLTITAVVGDTFGNPVQPGTLVYFTTTGGIIQPQGETSSDGTVAVSLTTGNPAPAGGFATITAQVGTPGSAIIKAGDDKQQRTVVDEGLIIKNLRSQRSAKGTKQSAKVDGAQSAASTPTFSRSITVLFSGFPVVTTSDTNFIVPAQGSKSIQFRVADANGNPLSQGTTIRVTGVGLDTTGAEITGDLINVMPDTYDRSFTIYNITVRDRRTKNFNLNIPLTLNVEVTGENGNIKRTIGGFLVSSISDSGKVGSINLVNASIDSVYVNGGGTPSSVPVQIRVLDASNNPSPNIPVTFTITKSAGGGEYLSQSIALTNNNGIATTMFYSGVKSGLVQIVGTIKRDTVSVSSDLKNIYIRTGKVASLNLISVSDNTLAVKGSGDETAILVFEGRDSLGNAVDGSNQTAVTYTLFGDTTGASVTPASVMTDPNNGRTTTTFTAGTQAGLIQLTASAGAIKSAPVQFTISGGLPSQSQFTLQSDKKNYSVLTDKTATITVITGDKYGNPSRSGTPIFFNTNGGLINSSSATNNTGQATAQLQIANPVPPSGVATIGARAIGEGNVFVRDSITVVFSRDAAISEVGGPFANFEIEDGLSRTFQYRVADVNNNPLAQGNRINVSAEGLASGNIVLSGDINVTTQDTKITGVGTTLFTFTARDTVKDEGQGPKPLRFKITVSGPNATVPIEHSIDGTLKGGTGSGNEGSVASVTFVRSTNDTIFVANAGTPTTDTITFKVRNLMQQPVSGAAVQFFLSPALNKSEYLSPSYSISNDSGEVKVVLHSGIASGVLGVQAKVVAGNSTISSTSVPVHIKTGPLFSIALISVDKSELSVRGVGGNENAIITFEGRDLLGNPIDIANQSTISFRLKLPSNDGESINPSMAKTDPFSGRVQATLVSGTKSKVLQVVAQNADSTITSQPVPIIVYGGFAVRERIKFFGLPNNVSIFDDTEIPIKVVLGDKYGNPVKVGTAVYFGTGNTFPGIITTASSFSNANGEVFANLKVFPDTAISKLGFQYVHAKTVGENGLDVSDSVSFLLSGKPTLNITTILATDTITLFDGANRTINYIIADNLGNPISSDHFYNVSVEGAVANQIVLSGDINGRIPDTQNPLNGTQFSFNFGDLAANGGTGGTFKIRITVIGSSGTTSRTINGKLLAPSNIVVPPSARVAASIALISSSATDLSISGVGGLENATLTYEVRDSVGAPIDIDNKVTVRFKTNFFPNSFTPGGTPPSILPTIDSTDGNGRIRVAIVSGTQAGAVQLEAVINLTNPVRTIVSQPVRISVNSGFADQGHFTIAPNRFNFPGLQRAFLTMSVTVQAGDKYSNPVKEGTVVYFNSANGIIQTQQALTNKDGFVTMSLYSSNPYPLAPNLASGLTDGFSRIYARTVGRDSTLVMDSVEILWTGAPIITKTGGPATYAIANGGSEGPFTFTVADYLGHPMSAGTTINIEADGLTVSGNANVNMPDTKSSGAGLTSFTISVRDANVTDTDPPAASLITVVVNHPVYGTYKAVLASGTVD